MVHPGLCRGLCIGFGLRLLARRLALWAGGRYLVVGGVETLGFGPAEKKERFEMIEAVLFYVLAAALIGFGILVITRTNPIASAMAMVGTFSGLAGLYAMLNARFLSIIQILVYAGGIMVLVIFVIMLLNLEPADLQKMKFKNFTLALSLIGVGALIVSPILFCAIPNKDWANLPVSEEFGSMASVGAKIFSDYLFPFEMLSLVLLTAVVGALVLAKRKL
jgi:NADH-quinone oxidoreductase subunit J